MAQEFQTVTPLWYRYMRTMPVRIDQDPIDYTFAQWVDEDAALANLKRAKELCGDAMSMESIVRDANYPIGQRLIDIDRLVRNGFLAMNLELWTHPAFVRNWRRFISGGDTEDVVSSRLFSDSKIMTRGSDGDNQKDTIADSFRWRPDRADSGVLNLGAQGKFGDGRIVRLRKYGRKWLRGIRCGEWPKRLWKMYVDHDKSPDARMRGIVMFTPSPWFWFRNLGLAQQTMEAWMAYDMPTHVRESLGGRTTFQRTLLVGGQASHNETILNRWREIYRKATPPASERDGRARNYGMAVTDFMGAAPLAWEYGYWHDFGDIGKVVAAIPPAFWWLEFYREFLDEVMSQSILDNIATVRKYVADRNKFISSYNFTSIAGLEQEKMRDFAAAQTRESEEDPTIKALSLGTRAVTGAADSVIRTAGPVGAIAGSAIGAAGMLLGNLFALIDKVVIKDDQNETDRVDEMGRVKPVLLPNSIWFRNRFNPETGEATPPQNMPGNQRLPVLGWIRPSEAEYYKNMPDAVTFDEIEVPTGFDRTPKTGVQMVNVNGRDILYPTGNAMITKSSFKDNPLLVASRERFSHLQDVVAKQGLLGVAPIKKIVRQFEEAERLKEAEESRDSAGNYEAPESGSEGEVTFTGLGATVCDVPQQFWLASQRDAWVQANPHCSTEAMMVPVGIPWWAWVAGGVTAVAVVGGVAYAVKSKKDKDRKRRLRKKRLAASRALPSQASAKEWALGSDNEDEDE